MAENPRVVVVKKPVGLIAGAVLLGVLLIAFIAYATFSTSNEVIKARMRGVVTAKNFTPEPEQQITIGKSGVHSQNTKGEYTITVRVQEEAGPNDYTVYMDEKRYNAIKIGDHFDVGPYLVR
ncbi:MAG: hypothetical protein ABI615_03240 [Chthoniobacterales bacterium]